MSTITKEDIAKAREILLQPVPQDGIVYIPNNQFAFLCKAFVDLQARIAELEAMLPKWHPYPAEKPPSHNNLLLCDVTNYVYPWYYEEDWILSLPHDTIYWATMPAPPQEEAK